MNILMPPESYDEKIADKLREWGAPPIPPGFPPPQEPKE